MVLKQGSNATIIMTTQPQYYSYNLINENYQLLFMYELITNKYLIMIASLCILAMLVPENNKEILYFNIEQASQGQFWRYITGHFVHYSWQHCISNVISLYCIYYVFSQKQAKLYWCLPTIFIICVISLGLATASESMKWYVGYSGVLIGLLSYSCVKTFEQNALLSFTFLLLLTTYIANQTILDGELAQSPFLTGISASSYAHLFGLIGGFMYGVIESLRVLAIKYR